MRNDVRFSFSWMPVSVLLLALTLCALCQTAQAQLDSGAGSSATQQISQNVKEVYFPFNIYNKVIDPSVLDADADWLKQHPDAHFWIQGYADVRGDIVYNLVLSYRRSQWIKSSLMERGVSESQIGFATGWGKLYPVCGQSDDDCFQKNRRVDMVAPGLLVLAPGNGA